MMQDSARAGDSVNETSGAAAEHYRLRLYVAGSLPNSLQAQENLRALCDRHLHGRCSVEVVDFLEHAARALTDGVIVTPTLVRLEPQPRCMIVGTLADADAVINALGLRS